VEWAAAAGNVATDAIWDAAGDLAVGSGANTAAKLAMGTALQVLRVNAGATALEWAAPAGGTVDSDDVTYAPTTVADWDGSADPGDVEQALDQLAERVKDMEVAAPGSTQGKQEFFMPASAMRPSITDGAGYPTTVETVSSGQDLTYIEFHPTTAQHIQFAVYLPKKWNLGTLTAKFFWYHPATVTNFGVALYAQLYGFVNDETLSTSPSWGTAQTVTDTGGTTNDLYLTAETSAITPGGTLTAASSLLYVRVGRTPSDGADTLAVGCRLLGVVFSCTTNADTDA
jgi:hypothetical protein